jgi:tellurite resistance protein
MEATDIKPEIKKMSPSALRQYIKKFPVGLFTSVMGIGGLSVAYQRYASILNIPNISPALLATGVILFISISLVYGYKLLYYRSEVVAEFNHPVKANFFAAISMSLLVLGIATFDFQRSIAFVLWCMGTMLQLAVVIAIASRWIMRDHEIAQSNPVWFLPAAGNLLVPIVGVEFAPKDVCWFFFSIGLFLWLALFTIVFYRIMFHPRIVDELTPTLFIMIAPPALGFIAYMKLSGVFDNFAHILLDVALFLVLLLVFMAPYFFKVSFSISWWAYTFPLCIATTAATIAYRASGQEGYAWIATILLMISSLAVMIVFIKTLIAAKQEMIFLKNKSF